MKVISTIISTAFLASQSIAQEFYPNWESGGLGPHVCLSANANETVPAGAPLFASLQECCSTHYGWNYDACIGNDGPSGQYFPNWGSSPDAPETCLLDDGTYIVPESSPTYADLSTCCSAHYLWKIDSCRNADLGPSNRYFPNWGNTPHICLKDDGTNVIPSGAPLYEDRTLCCASQYPWNLDECNNAQLPTSAPGANSTTTSPTASNLRGGTNPPVSSPSPSTSSPTQNVVLAQTKITSNDQTNGQLFGRSVSVSGNLAVVGASDDNNSTGASYVFQNVNGTWTQTAKLHASDAEAGDHFGAYVDIDQDQAIIVGAPSKNESRGSVYLFGTSGNFTEGLKVAPSHLPPNALFGNSALSLVVEDIILVVGAPGNNALHVLFAGVEETKTLVDDDFGGLGFSMSYDDQEGILAVGAPSTNDTGAVVLFGVERELDTEILTASDQQTGMQFGWAVDIDNEIIAVGAPQHSVYAPASGAVYVYEDTSSSTSANHTQATRLTPSDPQAGDEFGYSVVVRGDTIYVGAPGRNGSVYIFRRVDGTWTQTTKIVAQDASNGDMFVSSLDVSDEYLMIGSPRDDGITNSSTDSGSVYIIELA